MFGQQHDVVAAIAQRRQLERHHVQAEVQILAESLGPHQLGQLLVRGGQHANVGVNRFAAADADDRFFFQHAQQLGLAGKTHVADFVEEQRAAGGQLKFAGPRFVGVGECAFFVAEQLAFQQRFRERRAVDRNERMLAAPAAEVNRAGHNLLAGAVFAQQQHCQIRVGDAANRGAQRLNRRAFADDAACPAQPGPPFSRVARPARKTACVFSSATVAYEANSTSSR